MRKGGSDSLAFSLDYKGAVKTGACASRGHASSNRRVVDSFLLILFLNPPQARVGANEMDATPGKLNPESRDGESGIEKNVE